MPGDRPGPPAADAPLFVPATPHPARRVTAGPAPRAEVRAPERRWGWWLHVVAVLAVAAQLAFSLLPVLDGWRGVGAGPHVEAVGGAAHYAHAEDTCAACHAPAGDLRPAATLRLALGYAWAPSAPAPDLLATPAAAFTPANRSRAPPTVN